jgi:hypothetical protein
MEGLSLFASKEHNANSRNALQPNEDSGPKRLQHFVHCSFGVEEERQIRSRCQSLLPPID